MRQNDALGAMIAVVLAVLFMVACTIIGASAQFLQTGLLLWIVYLVALRR